MIFSMTGFGESERKTEEGLLRVEIRTVNHRFFNCQVRTPTGSDRLEPEIQKWLRAAIPRGHVHYALSLERERAENGDLPVEVDLERARGYRTVLETLREDLDLPGAVDLEMVTRFRDIFRTPEVARPAIIGRDSALDLELVREVTEEACAAVIAMRAAEGARLRADLEERLRQMTDRLRIIEMQAPERLRAERDRLREAIRVLSDGVPVDEERIAREVAHMAERWDIHEEIVRLEAHLLHFRQNLSGEGEAAGGGPVGKRLGFLVQEMHRETNTIGAKANDSVIAHAVMAIKEEIEKLREQLENVE